LSVALLFATCQLSSSQSPTQPAIYFLRWNTNSTPASIEVAGLSEEALQQLKTINLTAADWQKFFSIYARQGDFLSDMNVPAMLGSYRIDEGLIRFQPQYPLERGVNYRAVFRPAKLPGADNKSADIISNFKLPLTEGRPTTIVTQVYPSADVLPENLLKFYIHFSAPMQGGHIYNYIHLLDEGGKPVELPFLEIDEELWNADMTRLTLFIDPGRIKRGVKPLEDIGPALENGKHYILAIDSAWLDSTGLPLRKGFRKPFSVGPQDRESPDASVWKIKPPKSGTLDSLTVNFQEPMDQALALRVIRVVDAAGLLVEGNIGVSANETVWSFSPHQPWRAGPHQLHVQNTIEDLAGNNIGKTFEVDLLEEVQRRFTNHVLKLDFKVQ